MTKQFVIRTVFFLCGVLACTATYAQKYVGGNGLSLTEDCNLTPPLEKNNYTDDRGFSPAEFCALDIISSLKDDVQQPCVGGTNGIVSVTVARGDGDIYFWWPSRGGTKDEALAAIGGQLWHKVENPGTATIILSQATAGGYGFGVNDNELVAASLIESLQHAVPLKITELPVFSPGAITTSSNTVCAGGEPSNITETATKPVGGSGSYTYEWYKNTVGPISSATATTYKPAIENTAGVYAYTRKVIDTQCGGTFSTGTYTLTVVADPSVSITKTGPGSATICYNTNAGTLTAKLSSDAVGTPYIYTWQKQEEGGNWTPLTGTTASTYAPGVLTKTTSFKVSASGASGCEASESSSVTIKVNSLVATPEITASSTTVCLNEGLVFTVPLAANTTYTWAGSTGTSNNNSYTFITSTAGAKTATVKLTVLADGVTCESAVSAPKSATVLALPEVTTTNPTAICGVGNVVLRATASAGTTSAMTYTWIVGSSSAATTAVNTYTAPNIAVGSTTYSVTVKNSYGCISASPATGTITVNELPEVTTTNPTAICGVGNVVLSATASAGTTSAMTYTWIVGSSSAATTAVNTYSAPSVAVGSTTYSVTVKNSNGCISTLPATGTITVNALPTTPVITPPTSTVCQNATASVWVTSPVTGTTYSWTGSEGTYTGSSYTFETSTAGAKTATVTAKVTSNGITCESAKAATVTVNVQALPDTPTIMASASTVCENAALSVWVASPVTGATYKWTGSAGTATGSSYTFNTSTAGAKTATVYSSVTAGGVTCRSADATMSSTTVSAVIGTVDFIAPGSAAIGQPATFTVNVTPNDPPADALTYSWSAPSFAPAVGSGSSFVATTPGATGSYPVTLTVRSTGYCERVVTKTVEILNCINPLIYELTASASSFCEGGAGVVFALSNTESSQTYLLYKDNTGTAVSTLAGTGSAATFSGTVKESGFYVARTQGQVPYCEVQMKNSPVVTVHLLPVATATAKAICYDQPAVLTATLGAGTTTAMTYTWNIGGASSTTSVNSITSSALKATTTYTVQLKNEHGCEGIESSPATITVYNEFKSGAIASSDTYTICVGGANPVINSAATPTGGNGTYTYKWSVSSNGGNYTEISGATSASYPTTVTAPGTYTFKRVDADTECNTSGTEATGIATLLIAELPVVTIDTPASTTICSGASPITLTATVTKGLPGATYTYTWERLVEGDWVAYPNMTSSSHEFTVTSSTKFRVSVSSGGVGCASAQPSPELEITAQPAFNPGPFRATEIGTRVNLQPGVITAESFPISGSGTYNYQWYVSKNGGASTSISGATLTTYDPPLEDVAAVGNVIYTREVSDAICGGATITRQHTVHVGAARTAILSPIDTAVCNNQPFVLTSTAFAGSTYTWYDSTATGTWQKIADASNSNVLQRTGTTVTDTYYYKVVINTDSDYPGEVIRSSVAKVQVWDTFRPGSFIIDQGGVCPGGTPRPITDIYMNPATGGSGTYTYRWYKGSVADNNKIAGATEATYQPPALDAQTEGSVVYWRTVADAACQATPQTTGSYTLIVGTGTHPEPIDPTTLAVCDGKTITITAGQHAAGSTYTWFETGSGSDQQLSGQETHKLELTATPGTHYYKVSINEGGCGLVFNSAPATVTVYKPYEKGALNSSSGSTCVNAIAPAAITGKAPKGGDENYSYQWYKGDVLITGATEASYTPTAEDLKASGPIRYVRQEKDGSCATWTSSGTYTLTVLPAPIIQLAGNKNITICNGGSFTLYVSTASGASTPTAYTWEHSTGGEWMPVEGTADVLMVNNGPTDAGIHYYRAKVKVNTSDCEVQLVTDAATVTVYERFLPGAFLVSEGAACVGIQPQAITGLSDPTGGSGTYTYKWLENMTTELAGTAATYQPAAGTAGVKVYSRQVADLTCNTGYQSTTGLFILSIGSGTPTVDIVAVKSTICGGGKVDLKAGTVSGGTYTWESSSDGLTWTTRTESTASTISLTGEMAEGDHYYKVSVSTNDDVSCNNYTSVPATVTVRKTFDAGVFQVTEGAACPDATPAAITGVTSATGGDGNYTYQWYIGDQPIPDATAATYQPGTFSNNTTVVYTRRAKDGLCGEIEAGSYTLTVASTVTPTINLMPAVQEACNGTTFAITSGDLTGVLDGGYTWYSSTDGVQWNEIRGQNGKVLSGSATTATGVYYYKVEVLTIGTCSGVVVISAPATVTVHGLFDTGRFIVPEGGICTGAQPQAITGVTNPTGGSSNYTYQWYKDGAEINGATAATYQPPVSHATTPGKVVYTRKVADAACAANLAATTGSFTLNVGGIPTTDIVPASIVVCNDEASTLTAGLTAGTYTWEKSNDGVTWTTFGTDSRSVNIPATTTAGDYYYRVKVTTDDATGCNSFVSTPSTLTVHPQFSPGTFQVPTGAICPGATPAAITGVSDPTGGDGHYTYQWYMGGQPITGATAATYRPGTFSSNTTVVYTRGAKDGSSCSVEVEAGSYTLKVDASTTSTINLIPAVQNVCNTMGFTVASGTLDGAQGYKWYSSTNTTTWNEESEQTSEALNIHNAIATSGTHYYKVEVQTSSTCSPLVTSTPATVTVFNPFYAGYITGSSMICAGGTPAAITEQVSAAGGDENLSYRWSKDGVLIVGANAAAYTPKTEDVQTAGTTIRYTREVKDGTCDNWASSGTYTLTVTAAPTVTLQAATVTACNETLFSVTTNSPSSGTPNSHTWEELVNGAWTTVAGQTERTLTVDGKAAGEYYYRAKLNVTNGGCTTNIYSNAATVTVYEAFNAGSFTISEGAACINMQPQAITAVTIPTGSDHNYTYKWRKNGIVIDNATSATYQPPVSDAATAGIIYYTRSVTNTKCNMTEETAGTFTLKVGGTGLPTTNIIPDQTTVCDGATLTLTAGTVAGAQSYTWETSSDGTDWTGFGTNSNNVTTSAQTASGVYYYKVTVATNGVAGCSSTVTSVPSTITVREAFKAGVFQVTEGAICPGATPAAITGVSDPTGGDGHYTYQWYKDGASLGTSATAATYQPETFPSTTTVVYTRGAKDGSCSKEILSGSYTLTVTSSTISTINLVPAAQNICGTAFTVTSGTPDGAQGYTWYGSTDGVTWNLVSGQTNKTLNVSGATSGTYYYRVTVLTSSTCSPLVTSVPATVTVYAAFDAGTFQTIEGGTRLNVRPEAITGVSAPTGGSGNYTYQWYKNGNPVNNATSATYWPPVTDAAVVSDVVYTREVTDACGSSTFTSGSYTLKVGVTPTTNIVPVNTSACYGEPFTLTAGSYSGTYKWEESTDGVTWNGIDGTTNVLTVPAKSVAGVYYYNVTITTTAETITAAAPATVTVHEDFSAGTFHVTAGGVCTGETPATIFAGDPTGGSGNYTYQWYKDGMDETAKIAGATAAAYRPAAGAAGTYYRKVTDAICTASTMTSGSYVLTENNTPTTNLNPAVLVVCNSSNIEITTDLYNGAAYIWEASTNGTNYTVVNGQTNNSLQIPAAAGTHYYKVTVYNASACGAVTSTPATVTGRKTFSAGDITAASSICAGATPVVAITETVPATGGDENFSYRWYKESGLINGANAVAYTPKAEDVQAEGTVHYIREVKDGTCEGWTSSGTYTLTVTAAPTVALQTPTTITVCNETSFSVATKSPSAGTPNSYTWEELVNGAWTVVTGDAQTLTVTGGKAAAGEYYYRAKLKVTNGSCVTDIYSDAATVTVREAFNAGVFQVTAGAICPGATPAAITGVSNASGGDGTYTYQWYKDGASLGTSATAATYQPGAFSSATTAVYTRSAKDGCTALPITIGNYTLTVSESATSTINLVPAVQEVCNEAPFTVTSGVPANPISYKWEASADGAAWSEVTGANNTLDVTAGQTQAGNYYYRVTVTTSNTCSPVVTSTPATVTVREAFKAGVFQVTEGAICPGATPAAITGVSDPTGGDGHYTYHWYMNGDPTPISGATAATYQPEISSNTGTVVYTRGAQDGLCNTTEKLSGSYTLTVSESVTSTINLMPAARSACGDVAFTVTSGEPAGALGYTWYSSTDGNAWTSVSGQTTKVLTRTETTAGTYYYKVNVQTSNTCSPVVISAPATVTVYAALNAGTFLTTEGFTRTNERPEAISGVSAPTGGSGSYTYQWYKDGASLGTSATGAIYWPPVSDAAAVGNVIYTREVTDATCGSGTFTSGSYTLRVGATPTTNIIPVNTTVCNNTEFTLMAGAYNGTYKWEESTDGVNWNGIDGATNVLTVPKKSVAGVYYYNVTITTAAETITAATPATVTVHELFSAGTFHITAGSVCKDEIPSTIYAGDPTGGSGNYTYQWYKDSAADANKINGATAAAYRPAAGATGTYYRKVTDATCSASTMTSGSYVLTENNKPTTNLNPAVLAVCNGETIQIATDAYDGGIYKWEESTDDLAYNVVSGLTNVLNVPGKSSNTYYYRVTIMGASACGDITASAPTTVTVRGSFNAGTITATNTICAGGTPVPITETAPAAGGDLNYSYRWSKDGVLIAGANAAAYTPKTEDVQTAGITIRYTREVKDGTCKDWTSSGTYTLTVTPAPTVILQAPTAITVCSAASFSVSANAPSPGTANSHTWEELVNGAWTTVTGQTAQTLTVADGKPGAGDYYYRAKLKVTNGSCVTDIYSNAATVTVREVFNAGVFQVTAGAACLNAIPAAITGVSEATGGSGSYTYEWYKGSDIKIDNAAAATYQPETFSGATTVVYTRKVIDAACGTRNTSGSYTLEVGDAVTPTTNIVPANVTVCNGNPVTLTAGTVADAQTYKWEHSTNGLNWTDLPGQQAKDLQVAGQTATGVYYYRVTVTTSGAAPCNVLTSTPSTVTVYPVLSAGEFVVTTGTTCVNVLPAAITGNVTDPEGGDGHYTYQWYKDGQVIPDATAATYQPEIFANTTTVVYTRGVKDGLCNTSSYTLATGSYTLTIGEVGAETTNLTPAVQNVCSNASAFDITAVVPANALGYTWEKSVDGKSWNVASGQNTNVLHITSGITPGKYYYKVTVLSAGTCAPVITSTPATVTIYTDFTPGTVSGSTATCMRNIPSVIPVVTAPAEGSGSFTYQWYKNDTPIMGATDATYQPVANDVAVAGAYTFTREVTDAVCGDPKFSAGSYILKVNNSENVTATPSVTTVCYEGSFTIEATLAATPTTYTWQSSVDGASWTDIQGAPSDATLTVNPATVTAYYRVLVGVKDETCPGISNTVKITVGEQFTPGSITTAEKTICVAGTPEEIKSLAEATGGLGDNTYQWYVGVGADATLIPDATKANYTPTAASTGTFVYRRVVENASCGEKKYSEGSYTLRVIDAPVITVDDKNGCAGETVSLTATVVGESSAATYNWQYYNAPVWSNVQNGTPVNATYEKNGQTLTISGITAATTHSYRVQMSTGLSACPTVTAEAKLTISSKPVGGTVTASLTEICATTPTTLTLTGNQGSDIAWYGHNGNGSWTLVSSATTTPVEVIPTTAGTWSYMAVVSNAGCSAASSTEAQVHVKEVGSGGTITLGGVPYLCVGQPRTLTVTGSKGALQWERSFNGGAFTTLTGATSTAHTMESDLAAGTYAYRVKALIEASCPNTPVYSDVAELRIYTESLGGTVMASNGASSITMCHDGSADLKVVNYKGESFKWIYQRVSDSDYSELLVGTSNTCTLSGQLAQGDYNIRVIVDAGCGPDTSAAMRVVVKEPVKISLTVDGQLDDVTELPGFCKGNELVLKVGDLPDPSDKWTGTITSGAGVSTYAGSGAYWRVNTAGVSAPGTYTYAVTYVNAFCAPSAAGPITVDYLDAPVVGELTPEITEFCYADGASQTLTLKGKDANTTITAWQFKKLNDHPGVDHWDTESSTTESIAVAPTNPGTYVYRVVAANAGFGGACTTTYSNEVLVVKYAVPTINESGDTFSKCEAATVTHTFTSSVAGTIFKWEKKVNGASSVTGTGDIDEQIVYSGTNNAPQTVTYTVTPVIGTKEQCAGTPIIITYMLWPKYDIDLDETNSNTDLVCYGATDGRLVFNTSSSSPVTFTLSPKNGDQPMTEVGTAATFTGLGAGTYTLKVHNGVCETDKGDYGINGPSHPFIIANEKGTDAVCYGGTTGGISFEINGGKAPYKVSINNGAYVASEASFSSSTFAAGVYSVKVQDAKGCVTPEKDITVGQNPQLTLTVEAVTSVSAAGAHDATATLQAAGGSGSDYRYSATGLDNDFSSNKVVKGLYEGLNYVYAKDQKGCMVSAPIEVGKYPDDGSTVTISLTATVTKPLTCEGMSDAEITVQAFGSSNYSYSRDGVVFRPETTLKDFGAGVHTITVKDGAGRLATIDVTVNPAASLSFTATITKQLSGATANDAEVTLNITGDPAKFDYRKDDQWGSTYVFSGLSAQTYAFSVRYVNAGCEATPIVVGIPEFSSSGTPSVGITASITRALTCDNATAEITVTASGGNGTYSFSHDNGASWTAASTATVNVFKVGAGKYDLQVESGASYSAVITLLVAQPAAAPVINTVTPTATTCGNSNGSIDIIATGGVGGVTTDLEYSISGLQWSYSSKITGLNAGEYSVLARDGRGCMSNPAIVTVAASPQMAFEITSVTPTSTLTALDGKITVKLTSGQVPCTLYLDGASSAYSVNMPSDSYTFEKLGAGRYALTVTDANGCAATKNVLVGAIDGGVERISVTYTTEDPKCHDAADGKITVTARGGSGTYTYSLDDKTYGESNVFTGLLPGTYVVYVKDNATPAQKVYVTNVVLKAKEALNFTAVVVKNLSSATAQDAAIWISAKGGTAPYKYAVNGEAPVTNGYISGLKAGEYNIVVSDAGGCEVTGTIRIEEPVPGETTPRPSVSISKINDPSCFGGNDGVIGVTASGGRAPYAYSVNQVNWTTHNTITGLAAGTYTVYVKELSLNRITEGAKIALNDPARLTASVVVTAAITAPGAADGAVRVDAVGGKQPYQYSIDAQNTYQYGDAFTGLQAQPYTFYVKDGKGCVATTNIALGEPGKVTISAQVTKEIGCYGGSDAEITVTASGGTQPYQYRWDGVQVWNSSATLTGVAAGLHNVFVKDANGIEAFVPVFVMQPKMLAVTAQVTALPTGTDANGAIAIMVSGGSGNYVDYEVDNKSYPVPAVSGLAAGAHTIIVTDSHGCWGTASVYLASVDVIVSKTVINLQKGHESETYTLRLASAPAGSVTVGITDPNGLVTLTPSSVVFTPNNWSVEQVVSATMIRPDNSSLVGGITYFTTNVKNTVTSAPDPADAEYRNIVREVIVNTNSAGLICDEFESVTPKIAFNGAIEQSPFAICVSGNLSYELSTDIHGAGITYRWLKDGTPESTTSTYKIVESGTYQVVVMNANGCSVASEPFVVSMETMPEVPVILGKRVVREGQEETYKVKQVADAHNISYRWIKPSDYSLISMIGGEITMKIGATSSILRVLATRNNNSVCADVEGRLNIEVKASYGVDVFPTVASNGTPLRIVPKNMEVHSIAVINAVGESYAYTGSKVLTKDNRLLSGEEMQITVNGLSSGHYFIVFYGQEIDQDGKVVSSVKHSEHIVIKN